MIGWEEGRVGSPYTVEGRVARAANAADALTSSDPEFRTRMRRRTSVLYAVLLLPTLATIVLILKVKLG